MKKILLISILALVGCVDESKQPAQTINEINKKPLTVEKLMGTVSHGLHKVEINDTTTIIIYRGTESCTMIQVK